MNQRSIHCPQYGNGRLQPPKEDAAARAKFYQYIFMAETELTTPLAAFFWHTIQHPEPKRKPQVAELGLEECVPCRPSQISIFSSVASQLLPGTRPDDGT